jgi:biopolymer transport protein ExbB/TolQ
LIKFLFYFLYFLFVLLVGVLVWGYWYWQHSLTSLATNQAELLSLDKKITDLSQLKRLMAETATDRAKIGAYFLSTNTLPDFIDNLEGLATTTQVTLKVTNVVLEDEAAAVLTFETMASFGNMHRFIALVEQLPYQVQFTEANIANNGVWTGTFSLRINSFIKESHV